MRTSEGRKLAQKFIDAKKQYKGEAPTEQEVIEFLTETLTDELRYSVQGAKCLINWFEF